MSIDLHTHSIESDGDQTPEELVVMAREKRLTALAVSDHDNLEGSRRAIIFGKEVGLKVIVAAEISAILEGKVMHVLIYGVNLENEELNNALRETCQYRIDRARSIVGNINKELIVSGQPLLDLDTVLALGIEKPITRVDITKLLIQLKYVETIDEAFARWLEKYNIPNKILSVPDVCRLAHGAGGIAVLAHPGSSYLSLNTITTDFEEHIKIIAAFKNQGLDGIEVYHPDHGSTSREKYLSLAKSLGLVVTGGSDYHSETHDPKGIGSVDVPDSLIMDIEAKINKIRIK